jgi:hypothetical protein
MNGPMGAQLRCIYTTPGKIYTGSANVKLNYTTNDGVNWINSTSGFVDNGVFAIIKYGNNIVAGTNSGIFYNDTNISAAWTPTNNGITNFSITSFCISGSKIMAGTYGGGIFANDALTTFWYYLGSGLTNQVVTSLHVDGPNIYCGTYGGGMFKSTNQGFSWSEINTGLINFHISCITTGGGNVYCGTYGAGVFKSTDAGANWVQMNNGLFNTTIMGLSAPATKLFAATQSGVFATFDAGANWIQFNEGLSNQSLTCMGVSSDKVYVGVEWSGISVRNTAQIISVHNNTSVSDRSFTLHQNYPNPFNPSTNITFSLKKSSDIKLLLYDVSGKLLRVLQEGFFRTGEYGIKVNLQEFGTGIYFYSLETPEGKITQKMILAK